ncbi:MAG TPA: MFS transporter [Terriglobales bacterium]|jgi:fucose permease|nr:MFS transporter [Terriglobales bacterium]
MSTNSGKPAIVLSATVIFVYGTVASLLGTLLPSLSARFHLSPEQNGYIAAVQAVGVALATLVAGPLMDSKGVKVTLVGGLALMLVSLIGLLAAVGGSTLIVAILILGVGSGTVIVAANHLAGQVDERQRASAVNLANTFFGLGGLATPFIAANLLSGNPIRLAYLVAALTAGALLMTLSARTPIRAKESFHISQLAKIEPKNLLLLLCSVSFLYVGCEIAFWNWLPKYLMSRGNDARTALNILGFGFACGMIAGRLLALPLLRRLSAAAVCILAGIGMAAATFAVVHIASSTLAFVAVFLSGVAMGPVFPSALGITSDSFPLMTGTCIGLVITAGWCGAAISSWIIGSIAGSDPSRLGLALCVVPLFSVLIVVLSLAVRRMAPKARTIVAEPIAT